MSLSRDLEEVSAIQESSAMAWSSQNANARREVLDGNVDAMSPFRRFSITGIQLGVGKRKLLVV